MSRPCQLNVVRAAFKGAVVFHVDVAKGCPSCQALFELERAVYQHFAVKAAVGTIIDVLKENAIHCLLYGGAVFARVDVHHARLGKR